jgi:hypothetical protein
MHPVPAREHAGVRDTPASAANGLLSAIGLTVIAVIDFVACILYANSTGI